jgi:hypothetical protein
MKDKTWSGIVWIMAVVIILLIILSSRFEKVEGSEGTSLRGQQGAVTFQHTAACSVAILWMGPDTTSWEVDSVSMAPCFTDDSTIWCYEPTLNYAGDYFVKVQYHTNAAPATALYLADHWFVSDVQTGTSNNRDTLFVYDSADTTAISGVSVTVYPDGGGAASAQTTTDPNGMIIIGLSDGAYDYYLSKQAYDFNDHDDITISGDQTDTLWGTAFSPTPGPADKTGIFTWLITAAGDTISPSYVRWRLVEDTTSRGNPYKRTDRLTAGTGSNKILIDKGWHKETADSAYVSFNLVPNCDIYVNGILDTSSYYQFEGNYNGNLTWYVGQVPDTTNWNPFAQ